MKALLDASLTFRDAAILDHVRQDDIRRYLASAGWTMALQLYAGCEQWTKPSGGPDPHEAIVTGHQVNDHAARVADLISAVGEADGIPPLRLVLRLLPDLNID